MRTPGHLLFGAVALLVACAHAPLNTRLTRPLAEAEVNRERPLGQKRSPDLAIVLSFSGGGVRASALAYGVLEVLASMWVPDVEGSHRLLDEVTLISAVSGGSFPAAYYGLYGDRIFQDFEPRFLKGHVGRKLTWRLLSPINWVRLLSSSFGRSDLAAEVYDDVLFHGGTFADVNDRPGPLIAIQATDVVEGARFGFSAHTFGIICSDFRTFPVARAVAASSAFPIVFSPMLLRNYAGECDYREPGWIAQTLKQGPGAGRRYQAARHLHAYADLEARPWIYLVDGGVSDNLGLHRVFDAVAERGSVTEVLRVRGLEDVRRVAFVIVNAQTTPAERWGLANAAPGLVTMLDAVTSVQINRSNFESIDLLRRSLADWSKQHEDAGRGPLTSYVVEVGFDQLTDDMARQAFTGLPTTFDLPDQQIDQLRGVAAEILFTSDDFRRLMQDMHVMSTMPGG